MECYGIKCSIQYTDKDYTSNSSTQQTSSRTEEKANRGEQTSSWTEEKANGGDLGQQLKEPKEKDQFTIHAKVNLQLQIPQIFYKSICILNVFCRLYTRHVGIYVATAGMGIERIR